MKMEGISKCLERLTGEEREIKTKIIGGSR
jgi:hypothetical protein